MTIRFEIPGKVQPKERPRNNFRTPTKTKNYESVVALYAKEAMRGRAPLEGTISVCIQILCEIPKSWPEVKRREAINGNILPTSGGDLDNCIKSICDGMNNIAYLDDRQIAHFNVLKSYALNPKAIVSIDAMKTIADCPYFFDQPIKGA